MFGILLESLNKRNPSRLGKWADKFHLTIIAKTSVDIDDNINPPQHEPLHAPKTGHPAENKNATQRQNREERYTALLNIYNEEVKNTRKEDFNGLQRTTTCSVQRTTDWRY